MQKIGVWEWVVI